MIRLKQLLFEATGRSEITVNGVKIPGIQVDSPNPRYEWIFFIADDGNYYGARKNDPTRWVNLNVMSRSEYKDMVARIESWVPANIQRVKPEPKVNPKKDNTQSNASDYKNVETEPEDTDTNASDYKKVETDPSKDTGASDNTNVEKKPKATKYKRKLLRVRELDGKVKTLQDWAAFYKWPASEIQGQDPKKTFRHTGLIAQYDVNDTDEAAQHDLWYNNKEARQKVGGQDFRSFDIPGAPEGYRYTTYLVAAGDYERAYAEMIEEWKPFKWKQFAKLGYSVNPGAPVPNNQTEYVSTEYITSGDTKSVAEMSLLTRLKANDIDTQDTSKGIIVHRFVKSPSGTKTHYESRYLLTAAHYATLTQK